MGKSYNKKKSYTKEKSDKRKVNGACCDSETRRVDFHFHKDVEYQPKSFIAIMFIARYDQIPEGGDDSNVKHFQVRTDAFFGEIEKHALSEEIGKYLVEMLESEGYKVKAYDCISTLWCNPESFAWNMCNIMDINGFGFNKEIYEKAKARGGEELAREY